jgi:hypothetical protein
MYTRKLDDRWARRHDEEYELDRSRRDRLYPTGHGSYLLISVHRPSERWIETDAVVDLIDYV